METYSNDFKDMTDADPEMIRRGQREVVKAAVQRAMFCQFTGHLLDMKRTVVLMSAEQGTVVLEAELWDERKDAVAAALAKSGTTLEVYDGRELW